MKNKLRSCLGILLSLCMVLSACCFTAFAEGETQPLSEEGVYYVQHGATGNGLTKDTPGSFATVVADINEKYGADDTVTVKIVKAANEADTYTDISAIGLASISDIPAHSATLVLTSADENDLSWLTYKNFYSLKSSDNNNCNVELSGPVVITKVKLLDGRNNWHADFYANSHSVKICGDIEWYSPKVVGGTTLNLKGEQSLSPVHGGSRSTKTFSTAGVIEIADNLNLGNTNGFAISGYSTSGAMTFNEDITYKLGKGTAFKITVDNMNGGYAHFKKNVNIVLNGTKVSALFSTRAESKGTVIDGALQIIKNPGTTVESQSIAENLISKLYDITVEEGISLDVTSKAGSYTASGDKIAYAQSADLKTVYYSVDGKINIAAPGTYTVKNAADLASIKNAVLAPAGFSEWDDSVAGVLTAKGAFSDDEEDDDDDKEIVYYVKHGATGNGLSESTPGSFATVVAIINASYDADDTVTIKIVKGEYDDVASVKKADLGNVFHASMADIPAHAATLLITSADPASPSRLAWINTYMAENNKGKNITLTGPTILKDIKMIDSRINYFWDFYCMGYDLKIDSGVKWYSSSYNATSDAFTFEGRSYYGGINGGARQTKTFNSPQVIEFADNATKGFSYINFTGYNNSGIMTFNENVTMKLGAGKTPDLTVDEMENTYALFKKNVNVVLNGTELKGIINRSGKTDAYQPVIEGAFQLIRNNGATVGTNSFTAYKDTTRAESTDIYDLTVESGAVLDVTDTAGKYSVDSDRIVYAQSQDLKTAWYSVDGYITITEPGTYTIKTATSVDAVKNALAIPSFSSIYVFDSWKDDGKGTISATTKENEGLKYYVKSGATGDGTSPATPCSMKTAMTALNTNDGFIFVIGDYTISGADYASHSGHITIEGYEEGASITSNAGDGISFGGPVTLKNITYKRGNNAYIVTRGKDITFDEGFETTSSDDWFVFGGSQGNSSTDDINVTVNEGNFTGKFNVGAIMPASAGFSVKNDANININGGSVSNILLGSTSWGACGATTFEKSVVIMHNGGSIGKVSAIATGNGSPTAIKGSLVVINNNTTSPVYDSTLDSISAGGKYYITSGEGGSIVPAVDEEGNAIAGKFILTIDSDAINNALVENGDNVTTITESGEITLNPGTTKISYGFYPPNPGKTVPMTWKEMDKGYITLIFDDVRTDFQKIFEIVSKEYNLPLCAAVPSNNLKNNPTALHELQDRGGEILSHTKSHMVIKPFVTSWEDVETQLGDSYKILTEEGFNVNGIILAGGTGQIAVTDTEYRGLIELITNKYYKYSDKYGLSTQYWKQRNWFSGRTLDQLKGIVETNATNKTWEVIYGHDLTEVSEDNLRAFCEYLIEQQNAGKIKVVTYKYMHENFGDWESPVDFGDTTYTVEFYGTDKETIVEKQVIVEGEDASYPTSYTLAEGYTLEGWDGNIQNVDNNRKVYAICKDANGNTVDSDTDSVITPPPYVAPTLFYVDSANGSDANDGETAETPVASIEKAISLADSAKPFEVKIIGSYLLPTNLQGYTGMLTISGYNENSELYTTANGGYSVKSPLTLKNIKFTNGLYAWISLCGNKVVLGENVTVSGSHQIVAGGNYGTQGTGVHDVEISSGTWNKMVLGSIAASSNHTVSGDSKLAITGGTINNLIIGGDGWSSGHKGVVFNSNIAIKADGGTIKVIKLGLNNYAPTINGAVMAIFNNGTTVTTIDTTVDNLANKYLVFSGEGGKVDFVYENGKTVAGKFAITPDEGNYAIIENGGKETYIYSPCEITLSTGTTNVTYGDINDLDIVIKVNDGTKDHVFGAEDGVTITASGKITFPADMEKAGHLFGGWYSDEALNTPIANGSNVTAGTKIYAKWIELSEKDFYCEGVQIRIKEPTGLRFINNITHETRAALVALNSANAVLDPENAAFNASNGISYGTIVVPSAVLSGKKLEKGAVYSYNEKDYAAKTVPAKNTFEILDGHDRYTAVLIGISDQNLATNYSARAYVTYTDASGVEHTVYGEQYSASMYKVASVIYENGAECCPEENREEVLSSLYNNILSKTDGVKNPLANTYRALKNDKKLTVGYLGGSITYGSSAAKLVQNGTVSATGGDINLSYVNRTTSWLKETFPEAEIEAFNAGISDTATNFGIFRLEDHLMNENGHDMPDLVFVEFTSNDWTYSADIEQTNADISRQIESLVRNIYAANPHADIVFVFTARSESSASRAEYIKIAQSYGIECIDMGIPMQALMTQNGASNESDGNYRYTVDNLHPSAEGYGVYFEQIKNFLAELLVDTPVYFPTKKDHAANMPEQINRSLWLNPSIIPASEFTVSGTTTAGAGLTSSMYGTDTAAENVAVTKDSVIFSGTDATARFTFTGTAFGLIFGMNSSGFDIEYQIDGHGWKKAEIDEDLLAFQKYAHTQLIVFEQELAYGTHKIQLKFNPTSDGTVNVRIGGAAVAGVDNGFGKMFALTIDDGPEIPSSSMLLDIFEKYGAHATFFVMGVKCNASTKEVLNRMLSAGCEIGNHANSGATIHQLSKEAVLENFNACQNAVYAQTGVYPKVFRAPGLAMSADAFSVIPIPCMGGYSLNGDWKAEMTYETRLTRLRKAIGDGRVVLIHDMEQNAPVLEVVIPEAINNGYKIVTATELYTLRGYATPKYAEVQYEEFAK